MLEQALSCSRQADVEFLFDDGAKLVKGHRSVLCCASREFEGMFQSGMVEDSSGVVRVRHVSRASFKGFLEWVYLGRAGEECKGADGRELWLLSEMYDVAGVQRWLMEECVDNETLFAAYVFALVPEGDRSGLASACLSRARRGVAGVKEGQLRGLGADVVRRLLAGGGGRKVVREGFEFVKRWFGANGGWGGLSREAVDGVLGELDLKRLAWKDLSGIVKPSGLVDKDSLIQLFCSKAEESNVNGGGSDHLLGGTFGTKGSGTGQFGAVRAVAVRGEGSEQKLAAVDRDLCRVNVFNVARGAYVSSAGSKGSGPGQFQRPIGIAFNDRGDMLVSDISHHRISAFDASGSYLRSFGQWGDGEGQFHNPNGMAFTPGGELLVADALNHRVQVLREDGTFLRSFGSEGAGEGQFNIPVDVAAGGDGRIYVVDQKNSRVCVFDDQGGFQRTIGERGTGPGQFRMPWGVAVGLDGEILVSDRTRNDVQVFGADGSFVQRIGLGGEEGQEPHGVAVDGEGRLFVGCDGTCKVQMLLE